jgi:hypothetical protein
MPAKTMDSKAVNESIDSVVQRAEALPTIVSTIGVLNDEHPLGERSDDVSALRQARASVERMGEMLDGLIESAEQTRGRGLRQALAGEA